MATVAGVKPHPIYLAGSWVDSPENLQIKNRARPGELASVPYLATEAQYQQAVHLPGQGVRGHPGHAGPPNGSESRPR